MVHDQLQRMPAADAGNGGATLTEAVATLTRTLAVGNTLFPPSQLPSGDPSRGQAQGGGPYGGRGVERHGQVQGGKAVDVEQLLQRSSLPEQPPPWVLPAALAAADAAAGGVGQGAAVRLLQAHPAPRGAGPATGGKERSGSGGAAADAAGAAEIGGQQHAIPPGFTARLVIANESPLGYGSWRAIEWRCSERVHFPELFEGLSSWNLLLGDGGNALRIELRDANDKLVEHGPAAFAPISLHLLHCGAMPGKPCAPFEVQKTGKGGRQGKLLECPAPLVLAGGVCHLTGLRVKTNSSGAHNNEYKLGVSLAVGDGHMGAIMFAAAPNTSDEALGSLDAEGQQTPVRCLDAVSRPFRVKARRAEAIRKHHPAEILLDSEVWRLVHIKRDSRKVQQLRSLLAGRLNDPSVLRGPTVRHLVTQFPEDQWAHQLGIHEEVYADETLDHVRQALRNSEEKMRAEQARAGSSQGGGGTTSTVQTAAQQAHNAVLAPYIAMQNAAMQNVAMQNAMRLAMSGGAQQAGVDMGGATVGDFSAAVGGNEDLRALSFSGGAPGVFVPSLAFGDGQFPFTIARSDTSGPFMMAQPRYLSGAFLPQLSNGGFVLAQPPQQQPPQQQQPMVLDPQRSGSAGRPLFSWDPVAVQAGAAAGLAATGFHAATAGAKAAAAVEAAQAMATSNGVDRLRQLSHVAEELADIPPGPAAAAAAAAPPRPPPRRRRASR